MDFNFLVKPPQQTLLDMDGSWAYIVSLVKACHYWSLAHLRQSILGKFGLHR